jgi:hypothetical protein
VTGGTITFLVDGMDTGATAVNDLKQEEHLLDLLVK